MSWLRGLPHQIPFRAISRIEAADGDSVRGTILCSVNDALHPSPMPLEFLLFEAMAQLGGSVAFAGRGHAYLSALDGCEIDRPIVAGDRIDLVVTREAVFGGMHRFRGSGSIDGVECLRGRFYLSEPPSGEDGARNS